MSAALVLAGRREPDSDDEVMSALRLALPFVPYAGRRGVEAMRRLASYLDPADPVSVLVGWWCKAALSAQSRDVRTSDIASCDVVDPALRPVLLAIYDHAHGLEWYTRVYATTRPFHDRLDALRRRAQQEPALQAVIMPLESGRAADIDALLRLLGRAATSRELQGDVERIRALHAEGAELRVRGFPVSIPMYAGVPVSRGLDGAARELADDILGHLPNGLRTPTSRLLDEIDDAIAGLAPPEAAAAVDALRAVGVPISAPARAAAPVVSDPTPVGADDPVAPPAEPAHDSPSIAELLERALRILSEEATAVPHGRSAPAG